MKRHICIWKSVWIKAAAALLLACLLFGAAFAAGPAVNRWVVGAGGGRVEGGGVSLRAAIGQPVSGQVSNGISLCSGFNCDSAGPYRVYLPILKR